MDLQISNNINDSNTRSFHNEMNVIITDISRRKFNKKKISFFFKRYNLSQHDSAIDYRYKLVDRKSSQLCKMIQRV